MDGSYIYGNNILKSKPYKEMLLSAWVYIDSSKTFDGAIIYIMDDTQTTVKVLDIPNTIEKDVWTRVSATITPDEDINYTIGVVQLLNSGTMKVSSIQLEEGNILTDWTPAPEDIENRVDNLGTMTRVWGNSLSLNTAESLVSLEVHGNNSTTGYTGTQTITVTNRDITTHTINLPLGSYVLRSNGSNRDYFARVELGGRNSYLVL